MNRLFWIIPCCILSLLPNISHATVSCVTKFTVLGFSHDWRYAYWETEMAGDCVSSHMITRYDFTSRHKKNQFWGPLKKADFEGLEDGEYYPKTYSRMRRALQKKLRAPRANALIDSKGTKLRTTTVQCHATVRAEADLPCRPELLVNKTSCTLGPALFNGGEEYLTAVIRPTKSFYNPKFTQWLVLQEHCSIAQAPCYNVALKAWNPAPNIAVYDAPKCKKL